jgi:hypothetical protein
MRDGISKATSKVREAAYFYDRMCEEVNEREHFLFNLSAFLTAARSMRDYVKSDTKGNAALKQWWDSSQIHLDPITRYFDERRNYNVHLEANRANAAVDELQATVSMSFGVQLATGESLTIQVIRADGTVEKPITYFSEPRPTGPIATTVSWSYRFPDYPTRPRDVLQACHDYLELVRQFVADAQAHARPG